MGIFKQSTLLREQKLLTSRQIFRYTVPARTVTKKALTKTMFRVAWVSIPAEDELCFKK